ncbi:glycosyltransferase family 2 protein [Ralstonia pickettii]|uniref:glycosyltransferase family 2 protein n=1 Tax=Ralstonia pickettii TaxID=329 RepID=UPI0027150A45|nr:glycosyltransferase family 2 protein [Ralstonia pickettii]WKZ85935.1 glycosyltransferase family 2 protein [Ralstonia pickettii]
MTSTVIITMAGMGQRFRDAGYRVPKYQIEAHGKTLFAWSMLSLANFIRQGSPFIFVVRKEDEADDFIATQCVQLGIRDFGIVGLDTLTDGQATSAMLAAPAVRDPAQPMLVYNIDTFVEPAALPADAVRGDGWIPCFPGAGSAWSFAKADGTGRISELKEKERISDDATVGLYWFSSFALYARSYREFFADERNMAKGEKYIAPLYNHLIGEDRPVYVHRVPASSVIPLGTPADVDAFLSRSDVPTASSDQS